MKKGDVISYLGENGLEKGEFFDLLILDGQCYIVFTPFVEGVCRHCGHEDHDDRDLCQICGCFGAGGKYDKVDVDIKKLQFTSIDTKEEFQRVMIVAQEHFYKYHLNFDGAFKTF